MTINYIHCASVATFALSLAACSGGGPNATAAISAAAAAPPAATGRLPQGSGLAKPGAKAGEFVAGTLCTKPDQIVFSCPLERTNKIVSICAAGNAAPHRFYYAFGKAGAAKLVYPSKTDVGGAALNRTYLVFAGGTGGYAFSFHHGGYEYITYSISGQRTHDGGVLVRRDHMGRAETKLECKPNEIVESKNDALIRESLDLKPESDLSSGLPRHSTGRNP